MIRSRSIPVYNQEFQYHFYNLVRKGEREENKKIDMDRYNSLSLALMILAISLAFVDGAAIKLKSDRLCSQCSACDTSKCPASEAYPHMTAFDNTLIAGALQSDYVDSKDRGVYSVPNVLGGESSEHNAYFGWQSTSGSASGYHR